MAAGMVDTNLISSLLGQGGGRRQRRRARKQQIREIRNTQLQQALERLQRGGATDPAMLNRELADIQAGTQSAQQTLTGNLAQSGLVGSGLGQAIQAAIGQAGLERRGGRMALESQLADQRQLENLKFIEDLLGRRSGRRLQKEQLELMRRQMENESKFGWEDALGIAATGAGAYFGGPAGASVAANLFGSKAPGTRPSDYRNIPDTWNAPTPNAGMDFIY